MGWPSSEERVSRRVGLLIVIAGIACITTSLLYVLAAIMPLWYFYGYVRGYYSLLDHRLYYIHDGQPVSMPHTDYVRHVSMTFALLSLGLLIFSLLSILLIGRKPAAASGVIYGVSAGLGVQYGLLNGYLYRAIELDIGRFAYLVGKPNNEVVFKTNAGTIVFEGIRIESTLVYELAFRSMMPLVLLTLAIMASSIAAAITLRKVYESERKRAKQEVSSWFTELRRGSTYATLFMSSLLVLASVFSYYPLSMVMNPQPPPATLEAPLYPYTCTGLTRTGRVVLTYTDFETYPVPGWTSRGGTWSSVSGVAGAKGNVLRGVDDNGGIGTASQYYYNTRLDTTYTSLWVASKTRWASGAGYQYYGIVLINSGVNRLFTVEIFTTGTVTGYLDIWSYNVAAIGWYNHARVTIPNFNQANWYIIIVHYSVSGTTIIITAYLYDVNGNYVTSASATITHRNVFTPAYIGVMVDFTTAGGSVIAYFDDFMISTADPRNTYFSGLASGISLEVWDNLGNLVASGTAVGPTLSLSIIHDVVVGTGVDGRIIVRYPDAYLCGILTIPTTDAILGGDVYALSTRSISWSLGANKTSASVTLYISGSDTFSTTVRFLRISASQTSYARLVLNNISAPSTLNLDLWISGTTTSTNVTIRNGVPISTSTNIVQLNLGRDNYHALSGYFMAAGQSATLNLRLELCMAPGGRGACVSYPLFVTLISGSSTSAAPTAMPVEEIHTGPAEPIYEFSSPTEDSTNSEEAVSKDQPSFSDDIEVTEPQGLEEHPLR